MYYPFQNIKIQTPNEKFKKKQSAVRLPLSSLTKIVFGEDDAK